MHTHYKGTGRVHSFRGLLETGGQNKIDIEGSVGAIAWRITKFQLMESAPGTTTVEHTVKIYREEQASLVATVDFRDNELLAAAILQAAESGAKVPIPIVIFDNQLFVRNLYVSLVNTVGGDPCNYYIELEEVTVSAAGKAQLALAAARRTGDR